MATKDISTEQELDAHLLELQKRKLKRQRRSQRQQLDFDIGFLVFVLLLFVLTFLVAPVLPDNVAERVRQFSANGWEAIPFIFIFLALRRTITYWVAR